MKKEQYDMVVLGAGPGGYAAAFYLADHGKKVLLVEKDELGGVCLNRGCIPSKALLNAVHLVEDAEHANTFGIKYKKPEIDLIKLQSWKQGIIKNLNKGIASLAKGRNVTIIKGRGYFEESNLLRVETENKQHYIEYEKLILAVGSSPALPAVFDLGNPRIMTSTEALDVSEVPKKLLIIGAGYIGMELGQVYAGLGSKITMVEALPNILTGADSDLVRPVLKKAESTFDELRLEAKVKKMATSGKKIAVTMDYNGKTLKEEYDKVLVSVGRSPNSNNIGLENTNVKLDEKGFVKVTKTGQTDDPYIYAIGDIAGGILLAHKAHKEARIAAADILGDSSLPYKGLPAVVFTDPEIAWVGLTETEARKQGLKVKVSKVPWTTSGRAMSINGTTGLTKMIIDPVTEKVLGVGIVGRQAGELIAEAGLAIEMGAIAEDIAQTIHAHPTLSETTMEAAENFYGHATHIMPR